MKLVGDLPKVILENVRLDVEEVAYYLYLPISLPGTSAVELPDALGPYGYLVALVRKDEPERFKNEYVYLTVKRMIVGPGITPNRPGWHCDGFGTDDLNYVWYDCVPSVFNSTRLLISSDHLESLKELEEKVREANNQTYEERSLLKLTPSCVHRVNDVTREQMRTFVKISVSKNRYNLRGNSINPAFERWTMHERALVRNDPHKAQQDFYVPPADDHFK